MRWLKAVACLSLAAIPGSSAISVIGGTGFEVPNNTALGSASSTLNVALHDTLYISIYTINATCPTIVSMLPQDTTGNTWVQIGSNAGPGFGGTQCFSQWYVKDASADASDTVKVAWGATGKIVGFTVLQMRGVDNTAPLDQSFVGSTSLSTSALSSPSFTTTSASEILLYGIGSTAFSTVAASTCAGSTCTLGQKSPVAGTTATGAIEYLIVGSTQTGVTMAFTSTSGTIIGAGATFIAASGGSSSSLFLRSLLNGISTGGQFFANPLGRVIVQPLDLAVLSYRSTREYVRQMLRLLPRRGALRWMDSLNGAQILAQMLEDAETVELLFTPVLAYAR